MPGGGQQPGVRLPGLHPRPHRRDRVAGGGGAAEQVDAGFLAAERLGGRPVASSRATGGPAQGEGVRRQPAGLAVQAVLQGGQVHLLQLLLPASAGTLHSSCTTAPPSAYCSKQLTKLQVSEKRTTCGDAFPAVALTPCSAAPADRERCTGAAAGGGAGDGLLGGEPGLGGGEGDHHGARRAQPLAH